MEVFIILCCLLIVFPDQIYLNRGNHETKKINSKYGFEKEVCEKYNNDIYTIIENTYQDLPLFHVIEDKILVLHGGLFKDNDVTLKELENLPKPLGKEPKHLSIFRGSIWSDPSDAIKGVQRNTRGTGILFGQDVTESKYLFVLNFLEFLKDNNLSMIIRSHEKKDQGYEYCHGKLLITVFSCSNYCGTSTNKGAVITFEDRKERFEPIFWNYHAKEIKDYDIESKAKTESISLLVSKIYLYKSALLTEFTKRSKNQSTVSLFEWCDIMKKVLDVNIDFNIVQPYLAELEQDGKINYMKFINRFRIKINTDIFFYRIIQLISEVIISNKKELKSYFTQISKDGIISVPDLIKAFKDLKLNLEERQIVDVVSTIDIDKNGSINYKEFFKFFNVDFKVAPKSLNNETNYSKVCKTLIKANKNVFESFNKIDSNKDGKIDLNEFVKIGKNLGLDEEIMKEVYAIIDKDHDQKITFKEYQEVFKFKITEDVQKQQKYEDQLHQRVLESIYRAKSDLLSIFRKIDSNGNGKIDKKEFKIGLKFLLDANLTDSEIDNLYQMIDVNNDGSIDIQEFNNAFQVIDTLK